MSYLAYIAYENNDGSFDIHKSKNGGEEFYLTPYLQEVATGDADRNLSSIDPRKPWERMGSSPGDGDVVSGIDEAVSDFPVSGGRGIQIERIPQIIDFVNAEAVYIVRDDVELYLPVWTYPRVVEALREFFELNIYSTEGVDLEKLGELMDEGEPIEVLSGEDFDPSFINNRPSLKKYIEKFHLSLFQTGTNGKNQEELIPSSGAVIIDDICTEMNASQTDFTIPSPRGRGILVRLHWSDNIGRPSDMEYVRKYAESVRVNSSLDIMRDNEDGEDIDEAKREIKLIAKLVHHFSGKVSEIVAPSYKSHVKKLLRSYGGNASSDGNLFRVIEKEKQEQEDIYRLRKKSSRITPQKDLDRKKLGSDVFSVTPSEDSVVQSQFDHLGVGDIVKAELTGETEEAAPKTASSVELVRRVEVEFHEEDFTPDFVVDKFQSNVKSKLENIESSEKTNGDSAFVLSRSLLRSNSENMIDSPRDVGELVIAAGPAAEDFWEEGIELLSEEIYGGLRGNYEPPSEALFINPPSMEFWYVVIFEHPETGMSHEIRQELEGRKAD
jgi:hypothetical protein